MIPHVLFRRLLTIVPIFHFSFVFALSAAVELEDLSWTIAHNEVTITDCDQAASGHLEIPASIEGLPVKTIGRQAFMDCSLITGISVPGSVTLIGQSAFLRCGSATTIALAEGLLIIDDFAFGQCRALEEITIPASVTRIDYGALSNCDALRAIHVVQGSEHFIGVDDVLFNADKTMLMVFPPAKAISAYAIPATVTRINSLAFRGCARLTSIDVPSGVADLGNSTFAGCSALTSFTIPDGVTSLSNNLFQGCESLSSIQFPSGLKVMGNSVFDGCISIESVEIPPGITSYGTFLFRNCTGLTQVTLPADMTDLSGLRAAFERDPAGHLDVSWKLCIQQLILAGECGNSRWCGDDWRACILLLQFTQHDSSGAAGLEYRRLCVFCVYCA